MQFILYRYKNRRHLGRKAESIIRRIDNETECLDPIAALSSSFASAGLASFHCEFNGSNHHQQPRFSTASR
ncbi:Uncharacterised protein [Vibrio cholerae]|nr:Uncharacterised protein [Vibrio cholerae]